MSNTSIRPIPTLKGMFTVPRVVPGRNFLKENKQSLRSLEKATTEKIAAKKPVRPKWMPPLLRTASEDPERKHCETERLSLSRRNDSEICLLRTQGKSRSHHGLEMPKQQDEHIDRERHETHNEKQQIIKSSSRCQSCGTDRSSTSIGVQTEDIMDQLYLTNALKKCNIDGKSVLSQGHKLCNDPRQHYDNNYGSYSQYNDDDEQPLSAYSNEQLKRSAYNMDDNEMMPLPEMENLATDNMVDDEEAPLSARSRDTIATNATSKSKRRDYKLGSRDDLRLPRYLEKEKREKAEAKERMETRDPDCPRGHVLLSEQDRLAALAAAKNHFDMLINELNHMPMTAQTLRVRTRKAEIDKELTGVEDDIRIYSKQKVYVRAPKSRDL
ncbi:uncharacterized protein LOC6560429 [Drosophila grimshawi]|uniref:GH21167 n=1 Tax=Drosophila grimshawi TaxID=7222 RepID=B4J6P5_DROGR|nr:uncharacterized protein LOC6560429 [Drosophila grimshawi]EDW00948.1 GH21167 [Drosophila grimshawi]